MNIASEEKNKSTSQSDKSQSYFAKDTNKIHLEDFSIAKENVIQIREAKIKEQEKLWEQLNYRDTMKLSLIKLSYGIFSLFITTSIAIFSFVAKPDELFIQQEFIALYIIIILGMALINFSIIMHIISLKHSRILFIRQINCLRYAIESCNFAILMCRFPKNSKDLRDKNSVFYKTIGKHRKLPINNEVFREFHKKIFESADNINIVVITVLTTALAFLPLVYFWNAENSNIVGAASTIFSLIFISVVIFIMLRAKDVINDALNFEKADPEAD